MAKDSTPADASTKNPEQVAAMFDRLAKGYDRTNTLLSLGRDRVWRVATRRALDLRKGERCLDVAAGTGVSTVELAKSGAEVIGCDISAGMIRQGQARFGNDVTLIVADALNLPFVDGEFDAVTITFGLRNVTDVSWALAEFLRVTRPGGRLVVCEFSAPTWQPAKWGHRLWLRYGLPSLARFTSSDPSAYSYLAETINTWPAPRELAQQIQDAGWGDVAWRSMTFGAVTIHKAVRPIDSV